MQQDVACFYPTFRASVYSLLVKVRLTALGQVAEKSKVRAWRAGCGTTKLETEFTLFTYDRTILPPIVTCSFHFPCL